MITTLEQIAADPYTRRVMEEEEFMAMNIDFWKRTIVNKDSIIESKDSIIENKDNIIVNKDNIIAAVSAERDIAWSTIAQRDKELAQKDKKLEEYIRRYGNLNGATI